MHEEKNIDTVIQSIYRLRGTGQFELFREVLQFIAHLSVVFLMHEVGADQDRVPARTEMIVPKSLLLKSLLTDCHESE